MNSIDSISQFHKLLSLPEPLHPLISVVRVQDIKFKDDTPLGQFCLNFYSVSFKKEVRARMKYGKNFYDFDKGTMIFTAPRQIQSHDIVEYDTPDNKLGEGYVLFFHPSFLGKHSLASVIKTYGFFSYEVNEALHLSEMEERDINDLFQKIDYEHQRIDRHTQDIILSQLDLLLNYCNRFYERQFITRKAVNHDLLTKMEELL